MTSETGIGKHDFRSILLHPMLSKKANHIRRLHVLAQFSRAICMLQERFLVLDSCDSVPLHLYVSIPHRVKTFFFCPFVAELKPYKSQLKTAMVTPLTFPW